MASTLSPITITDEEIRRGLPADENEANAVATEMLRALLIARDEPPEHKLENRPDWQEKIERARQQIADNEIVTHEELLEWKGHRRG